MRPDDNTKPDQPTVRVPSREGYSLVPNRPNPASASRHQSQAATASLARQQIDAIYSNDPDSLMEVEAEPATQGETSQQPSSQSTDSNPHATGQTSDAGAAAPSAGTPTPARPSYAYAPEPSAGESTPSILRGKDKFHKGSPQIPVEELIASNPYDRTHDKTSLKANDDQWKQYHTAWQNYYQQYFHRYYAGHLQQIQSQLQSQSQSQSGSNLGGDSVSDSSAETTPEEAMKNIRRSIRDKIQQRAKKVRKSRHFMPLAAALSVMIVFAFLQYNRVLFSNINAYIVPSTLEPTNLIVDPTANTQVGPEPKLIIPKVNIDVPVVWNTRPDHDSQMKAMENGVAWFGIPGANSKPGQVGNTVLSGHSSNDFLERGDYKFVFAPLHRMSLGDNIYINYEGTRYTYTVTKIDVVKPTDVDALRYPTDKPMLTLITCTPLGTALNRLLITAEQVLPDPGSADPAPSNGRSDSEAVMPGNQPTVLERVFGAS